MAEQIFTASGEAYETNSDNFTGAANGTWYRHTGPITVQVNGNAATFTAKLERSPTYPGSDGLSGKVASAVASITGNSTTGVLATYTEGGVAWYRVVVSAVEATKNIDVYISGRVL